MSRIYPFRALRYNPSLVRVQDVVTQPYDKITPAMQQAYYRRSPYNLVRVILGLPELFDDGHGEDVYHRAARDFAAWRRDGILVQEADPCVYAYSQTFTVPGTETRCERRGFIALGELYDYDAKVVFRHERTLARPKNDRLSLLRATRANFGQIFMLYSDPGMSVERLLFDSNTAPEVEVSDEHGTLHRLWRVGDPAILNLLPAALEDKKLIIADGHHRYETALAYAHECAPGDIVTSGRKSGTLPQPAYPEAAAMMTFVNMDSPGLVILPTHRVVHDLPGFDTERFLGALRAFFTVEPLPSSDPAVLTARLASAPAKPAFGLVTSSGAALLTAIPSALDAALAHVSERQRRLDAVCLHQLVFEKVLGISPEDVRNQAHLRYLSDPTEAVAQITRGGANAAFLMNPATLDELREVAFAGEVMPQKSTDFFPKLLSGLTIYALD